jgi:plastocyanin
MKRTFAVALAATALAASGCGGDDESKEQASDTGTGASSAPAPEPTAPDGTGGASGAGGNTTLKISADPGGGLSFDKEALEAKAGKVTIEMDNPSSLPHAVSIEGDTIDVEGNTVEKGGLSTVSADVEPGTYEYYCPVGGHQAAGMTGELTVK